MVIGFFENNRFEENSLREKKYEVQIVTWHSHGWDGGIIHNPECPVCRSDVLILDAVDVQGTVDVPDFVNRNYSGLVAAQLLQKIKNSKYSK